MSNHSKLAELIALEKIRLEAELKLKRIELEKETARIENMEALEARNKLAYDIRTDYLKEPALLKYDSEFWSIEFKMNDELGSPVKLSELRVVNGKDFQDAE